MVIQLQYLSFSLLSPWNLFWNIIVISHKYTSYLLWYLGLGFSSKNAWNNLWRKNLGLRSYDLNPVSWSDFLMARYWVKLKRKVLPETGATFLTPKMLIGVRVPSEKKHGPFEHMAFGMLCHPIHRLSRTMIIFTFSLLKIFYFYLINKFGSTGSLFQHVGSFFFFFFRCGFQTLSCLMWSLVPWPGIEGSPSSHFLYQQNAFSCRNSGQARLLFSKRMVFPLNFYLFNSKFTT